MRETTLAAIAARPLDGEEFAPFGRIFDLTSDASNPDVVVTQGSGWIDRYTRLPLIDSRGSLGMTIGEPAPYIARMMERHENTEEALFPTTKSVVLLVAAPDQALAPDASQVRAFIIPPGTAVVLHRGTWHDACHGVGGTTAYFWFASTEDSQTTPWTPISGGPIAVEIAGPEVTDHG